MIPRWVPLVHLTGVETRRRRARRRRKHFSLEMLLQEVEAARRYCMKAWGRCRPSPSQGRFLERLGTVARDLSKARNTVSGGGVGLAPLRDYGKAMACLDSSERGGLTNFDLEVTENETTKVEVHTRASISRWANEAGYICLRTSWLE